MTGHFGGREMTTGELKAIKIKQKMINTRKTNISHNSTAFWSIFENILGS
jgi:hypothetical protein